MRRFKAGDFKWTGMVTGLVLLVALAAVYLPHFRGTLAKTHGRPVGNDFSRNPFSKYLNSISNVKVVCTFVTGEVSPYCDNSVTMVSLGSAPTSFRSKWLYESRAGVIYVNTNITDGPTLPYSYYGFE